MTRERALQKLGKDIREELNEMADPSMLADVRGRLVADLHEGKSAPKLGQGRRRAVMGGVGLTLAAAAALLLWLRVPAEGQIPFQAGSAKGQVGEWLAAPTDRPLSVDFDNGTHVSLLAGTRARVAQSDEREVWVIVEAGTVEARIRERDENEIAQHRLDFGAASVRADDAELEARYAADGKELDVIVTKGEVLITSPTARDGVMVRAGQQARLRLPDGALELQDTH